MTIFINNGSYFSTKIALGAYQVFYATGDRWVGLPHKFWPTSDRYLLSTELSFSETQEDETKVIYHGHIIDLIMQKNGNLDKRVVSEAEFGE